MKTGEKRYDFILMDLDDTIIDDIKSMNGAYKSICRQLKLKYSQENFKKFADYEGSFWRDFEDGKIRVPKSIRIFDQKVEWLRAQRFLNNFEGLDFSTAVELDKVYCKSLSNHVQIIENAENFIKYLASKYSLIIATNGPKSSVLEKLKKAGVKDYFGHVIVAEEIGESKPKTGFFYRLMDRVNYHQIERMAIIGDSISSDIKGGTNVGMDTYWFNHRNRENHANVEFTKEFKSYLELYSIL